MARPTTYSPLIIPIVRACASFVPPPKKSRIISIPMGFVQALDLRGKLQRLFHHDGERAVAKAAQKFGTMFGISSLGTL